MAGYPWWSDTVPTTEINSATTPSGKWTIVEPVQVATPYAATVAAHPTITRPTFPFFNTLARVRMASPTDCTHEQPTRSRSKFLNRKGGTVSISDLHLRSQLKYGAGHRDFSDIMESLVKDGYVEYDDGSGEFSITEAGRAWIGVGVEAG